MRQREEEKQEAWKVERHKGDEVSLGSVAHGGRLADFMYVATTRR